MTTFDRDQRINYINIGLMLASMIAAFIMPFEVFLFAYAFMGPLHYLTEISWLHDRNYFTKGKYDFWFLIFLCLLLSAQYFVFRYDILGSNSEPVRDWLRSWNFGDKLLYIAFFGALVLAFVRNLYIKLGALALIFIFANGVFQPPLDPDNPEPIGLGKLLLTSFVPTLIHVYVFTGIFMLFGALKSRSKSGLLSVVVFTLTPFLLWYLFQDNRFLPATEYGIKAFGVNKSPDGFFDLNQTILGYFFNPQEIAATVKGLDLTKASEDTIWFKLVYESQTGVLIMRFIAFAYTYHYLNWFSKTEIIRWHKVPKIRFAAVIVLWLASLAIYAYNYALGLQWLFFLSFSHVLLEFPLNFTSFVGIFKEGIDIASNGFNKKTVAG
jgi:hypothetical protein